MADVSVRLEEVRKTFGQLKAVDGIDLTVARGEFLTLLGPSGCGKTTTLNMIAGFVLPDSGAIYLAGRPIDDLPPFRRDIGLVFQDYALFPHMAVEQNVAFGLRMRKVERSEIASRVKEALGLVKLSGLGSRRPLVNVDRRRDLLDLTLVHHGDPIRNDESFALVVRHQNGRDAQPALQ